MDRTLPLVLILALAGCGPSTPGAREADDRDLERDILWEFRENPKLSGIRVKCQDRAVTLEGSVPDAASRDEAVRIASQHAFGRPVRSQLVVKPR